MSLRERALGLVSKVWDGMPPALRRRVLHATNPRFLVGVVGLITDESGRVLLLEHRFRTPWRWGLPGGFINRGESLAEGLARELREEIGISVTIDGKLLDTELNIEAAYVSVTMTGHARDVGPIAPLRPGEILSGGFYGPDELPEGTYPYHAALIRQHAR